MRVDGDHARAGCRAGRQQQPLPRTVAQRLLCDAVIVRVLTKGGASPLEVGRASRGPTAALLRALLLRDGGCAFPGCETAPRSARPTTSTTGKTAASPSWATSPPLPPPPPTRAPLPVAMSHRSCDGLPRFTDPDGIEHAANPTPLHHARTGRRIATRQRASASA